MADPRDRHKEVFREEAYELLTELEEGLLELESDPGDRELIGRIFRALHTIKGSGSMFGFDEISAFAHEVENVFELVRNDRMAATKPLVDATLKSRDFIRKMLDASTSGEFVDEAEGDGILAELKSLIPQSLIMEGKAAKPVTAEKPEAPAFAELSDLRTYRIGFRPSKDIFKKGSNPLYLIEDLRALGHCQVVAQVREIPPIEEYQPESCYTYWDVILTTSAPMDAIKDVFIFEEGESRLKIELIDDAGMAASDEIDYKRLGEILIERGDIAQGELEEALKGQCRIGDLLIKSGMVESRQVESALTEQEQVKGLRFERRQKESASTIRVPSDKLDKMVDLVGELVTVQARLTQKSQTGSDADLLGISEEVERLTAELHDNTMSIRMVPIGSTFSRFRRLVRDLSSELGKDVELKTAGAETELDKTVIEKLSDPLVHLIRNCVDHGIERPDVREAAGKPRRGVVMLAAEHSGADVLIKVKDDGAGLDAGRLREKAVEMGLLSEGQHIEEADLYDLIFAPGFSTARRVTGVSGRGVGMDVVKKNIESLRGSVEVSSKKGLGTTLTLRLPLTLAIIDGLLVRVGGGSYVMPLQSVEECVELRRENAAESHGRHLVKVRGELVPYVRLREWFAIDSNATPSIEQIVIVSSDGFRAGLVVDQVVGGHQTVIKTLGKVYRHIQGISGATILGDGTVALIIDIETLLRGAEIEERESVTEEKE